MGGKSLKRERVTSHGDTATEIYPKKRRQVNQSDLKLSKLYEDLAAEIDDVRLEAAKQIIVKFSPENEPSADAILKAINRLIRGLCSQRKAARVGFCVTLTEFLRQLFGQGQVSIEGLKLSINDVVNLVEEKTKPEGKVPGQERRDHLIGKLFGFKAVIQSSVLVQPEIDLDPWNKVLDHIYGMARDIPWLREECGLVLIEAVTSLASQPDSQRYVAELTRRLVAYKLVNTPEGVALWLRVTSTFQDALPDGIWHSNDPLCKKERTRLAKTLKEDFRSDTEGDSVKSAAANANPIFAWDVVLAEVLRRDEKANGEKKEFPAFWLDTVDSNLFSSTSSHERKSWGFKLFASMVLTVPEWALPALFGPNFMRSLINQSKKDDRYLYATALAALKAVQARVQQVPNSAVPIFAALTTKNGTVELDKITKTKTLEQVMLSADDESLTKIVRQLRSLILRPEVQDQSVADARRQTIADILLNTIRSYKHYGSTDLSSEDAEDSWLHSALHVFVENAYFVPSRNAKTSKVALPPVSDGTRSIFQERLSSCLTRLLRVDAKSRASFALLVVNLIRSNATSRNLDPVFKADETVLATVNEAFQTLDTITSKKSLNGNKSTAEGFSLLYALALLQVYNGDTDAVLLLDDLDSSRKSLLKTKKKEVSQDSDVFVEVILSFLGNPRTLFRRIAEDTFTIFASEITSDGLASLSDILDTVENMDGQKALFEQGEGAVEGDDSEEDSDVEMIEGDEKGSEAGSSESSASEDDDNDSSAVSGSDDDEEDDEELARFDDLLAHTLQTSKLSAEDGAEETSDESDMDDEQMMALDPHLTKIFQERSKTSSQKKQREDAKQNVVQFKSRVLDLLAIYMDKEYSNPLTLQLVVPILRRIRAGANKQLTDKSYKLLKTYTDTRAHHKAPLPIPKVEDEAWDILRASHEEAKLGGGSNLHATACSNVSLHLAKILVGLDKDNYAKIVDVYAETQKQWFMDKKSNLQPVLFTQFHNWSLNARRS